MSTNICNLQVTKNTNPNQNRLEEQQTKLFDFGRTESDATHPILRSDHQRELVDCLTCGNQFKCNSYSDICSHYIFYHPHILDHLPKCLYCKRDVHRFQRGNKSEPEIYHFCSPRKQR
uniref:Uncharacterized protein n=1 Tax=Drosophila melanogaster TaxID=7227 RepID=A0A6H2EFZ8_DROME|nr:uncharacterized protein Dmel_CG46440 [Drosophila melanogaster]QJC18372.1 uncharacterized protein Dmel_CG46440 [Drosophila melanogaster]